RDAAALCCVQRVDIMRDASVTGVRRVFFSSRRRNTRFKCDWSSDVCSSDLATELRSQKCGHMYDTHTHTVQLDRKSVVEGKSVDLGGRRIIKQNSSVES